MSLTNIKAALVNAYVTGAFGLPTAYENRVFDTTPGVPWAAVHVLPAQPDVFTLGSSGRDEHTGILQIDLFYPLNTGDGAILAKADAIRTYFKAGTDFDYNGQTVTIRNSGRSGGRRDEGWYSIIMTIEWYAYTTR